MRRKLIAVCIAVVAVIAVFVAWDRVQERRLHKLIEHVAQAGGDADAEARRAAMTLSDGASIERLVDHLDDTGPNQEAVVAVLGHIGAPAAGPLVGAARKLHGWQEPRGFLEGKWEDYWREVTHPPHTSAPGSAFLPSVLYGTDSRDERLFAGFTAAFAAIGDPAVADLVAMTKAEDRTTRVLAVSSLVAIRRYADRASRDAALYKTYSPAAHDVELEAVFTESLKSDDAMMRRAGAFGLMCTPYKNAKGVLMASLADPDRDVRAFAATALGRLHASDPDVLERFVSILKDTSADTFLRGVVAEALASVDDARVTEALVAATRDRDTGVATMAVRSLAPRRITQPRLQSTD